MTNQTLAPALAFDGVSCVFASNEEAGARYVAVGDTTLHVAPGGVCLGGGSNRVRQVNVA